MGDRGGEGVADGGGATGTAGAAGATDPTVEAFFALHAGLPRQGPGSAATTRRLLSLVGPLPANPRVLDLGCGPGPSALLLAAEAKAQVTAVDLHQPFLDELTAAAAARGLSSIHTMCRSMADLPFPDHSWDLLWAEGSVYTIGFDTALASWRRLIAPGGALVVTEAEWTTDTPSAEAHAFWERHYPLRTTAENTAAAEAAGYAVAAVYRLPDSDWFDEYYAPLAERIAAVPDGSATPAAMATAVGATREEIALRVEHGQDYCYTGYVLRPRAATPEHDPYPGDPGDPGAGSRAGAPRTTAARTAPCPPTHEEAH